MLHSVTAREVPMVLEALLRETKVKDQVVFSEKNLRTPSILFKRTSTPLIVSYVGHVH
jgi:hypothetical protein